MIHTFGFREWGVLVAGVVIAVAAFQFLGQLLHWPMVPGHSASLIASPHVAAGVATLLIGMVATMTVGTLTLGWLRAEAGLFVSALGLAAMANRGGTVGALLRTAEHPHVYLWLLGEMVLLLFVMGVAWQTLILLRRMNWISTIEVVEDPDRDLHATLPRLLLAAAAQAIATALLVQVLAQADSLKQALAAVGVASLIGAIVAHQLLPVATSVPFWIGPFLVGIGGFAWAGRAPGQWAIGVPANPLAMVPPLGYASMGVAGAILGYWVSRKWRMLDDDEMLAEDAAD